MGKCKYCQREAGFFHSKHEECERKHLAGMAQITAIINDCFISRKDFYLVDKEIKRIMQDSFIDKTTLDNELCALFDNAVDNYLNDGIISTEEKQVVARFIQYTGIEQQRLNANFSLEKVLQSEVLQDILAGNTPSPKLTISGNFPFLLGKSEHLVWFFRNITLYQQKVQREYVGRNRGVSVRIMKGVYYRTGGFKGHPIEREITQRVGVGCVCLTDKNLYFSSPVKSIKIPYSKMLCVESFSNGISIQKDGTNDKPLFFENLNSWFTYNVIANLK